MVTATLWGVAVPKSRYLLEVLLQRWPLKLHTVSNVIAVPPCTRTVAFDADSGLSSDEDLWNFGDDEF